MPNDERKVHYFNVHEEHCVYHNSGVVLPKPEYTPELAKVAADAMFAGDHAKAMQLSGAHMLAEHELKRDMPTIERVKAAFGGKVEQGCYVNFDGTEEWKTLQQYRDDLNAPEPAETQTISAQDVGTITVP